MASRTRRPVRLVLLECVTEPHERGDRSHCFPFWMGWARDRGIPTRWICLAGRLEKETTDAWNSRSSVHLDREEAGRLLDDLREFGTTHLLANRGLEKAWTDRVREALPGIRIVTGPDSPEMFEWTERIRREAERVGTLPAEWRRDPLFARMDLWQRERWFSRWLGQGDPDVAEGPGGRRIADVAEPRYDAEMFHEAARRLEPMLPILGEVLCDWAEPLQGDPIFRRIDLSGSYRTSGCSFCGRRMSSPATGDPLEYAEQQFRRLLATGTRSGRDCGRYDFQDIRVFLRIDEWVERAARMGIPPSEFCFSPRVDHVLRAQDRLRRALPLCAEKGHVVRLFRMGAESFSDMELQRFHKGVSVARIEEALGILRDLQSQWPGTFRTAHPPALIPFTPWTTLEDVRLLLEKAVRWNFPDRGRWIFCALEMNCGLPITALAESEGDLLVERFEDPALLHACSVEGRLEPWQSAWRFRDRRVALYHGVLVRYCVALEPSSSGTVLQGDPLQEEMRERIRQDGGRAASPLVFARALLDTMAQNPHLTDALEVWRRTHEDLVRSGASGPPMRVRMLWIIARVLRTDPRARGTLHLEDLVHDEGSREAILCLRIHGRRCTMRMTPVDDMEEPDLRSRRFAGRLEVASPIDRPFLLAFLARLLRTLDSLVPRFAPLFLTGRSGVPEDHASSSVVGLRESDSPPGSED